MEEAKRPAPPSFESVLDDAADCLADGLTHDIERALANPIVRALIAADTVDSPHIVAVLRKAAAQVQARVAKAHTPRRRLGFLPI